MEKINTNYKQQILKSLAKLFKPFNRENKAGTMNSL